MRVKCSTLKIISLVIIMGMCMMYFPVRAESPKRELITGDANCDGEVNTYDAVEILRSCTGICKLDLYGTISADMNGDDMVNTNDATALLRTIISDDDILKPIEVLGDINSPVFYTDIFYETIEASSVRHLILSEYTADAVESPKNTVAFGQGYKFELKEGHDYVFETRSTGSDNVDTVIYLIDNANNLFMTDDNSGDGKYSRIEFHAWETNIYKLLITGKNSSDVGTCELEFSEHTYVTPAPPISDTPTPKPTSTPTSTPTPTQTPGSGEISFANQSLPTGGAAIQYKSPYSLRGTISANAPIVKVRAEVINKAGNTEQTALRNIAASLNLRSYALTDGGNTSIDGQLLFSQLSIGRKTFKLYCTLNGQSEKLIFTATFYVGATDAMLDGNAFAGSAALSSGVRQEILDYINSMDENNVTTQIIMEAVTKLGVTYGTSTGQMDCSSYVQWAYAQVGINLPRTSVEQAIFCYDNNKLVSESNVRSADLVFFRSTNHDCGRFHEIHHVAIFLGPINGVNYYLEASSGKRKVVLRRAWGNGDTSGWAIDSYGRPY